MGRSTGLGDVRWRRDQAAAAVTQPEHAVTTETVTPEVPPPPPVNEPPPRVPMNVRILVEHDRALRTYQRKHTATRQAVIDQALTEYLERRGLLASNHANNFDS